STVTPSGASMVSSSLPSAVPFQSCRPLRRRSGVKRHSSSRPLGTGKSFTSWEPRVPSLEIGTCPSPWLCAFGSTLVLDNSAHRPFHLEFDQTVQLQRVFHRELACDGFHEASDHH